MKKLIIKKWVIIILIVLGLLAISYHLFKLFSWKKDVEENHKVQEKIKDNISISDSIDEDKKTYQIDFDKLKSQNEDTIAYIKVLNTNIDYVVVKGKDNSFYLNHNFYKEKNVSGWIFADYQNKFDGQDKNIILYGHNTQDGSMFGTLKKTMNSDWYNNSDNYEIILITEKEQITYSVFSIYSIVPEDYYIQTSFINDLEYETFLKTIQNRSIFDFHVDLDKEDQILTLSSCLQSGSKRIVLHAKKTSILKLQ